MRRFPHWIASAAAASLLATSCALLLRDAADVTDGGAGAVAGDASTPESSGVGGTASGQVAPASMPTSAGNSSGSSGSSPGYSNPWP